MVEFDSRITEYPVHSYVLFTPPVGRGDKLLPRNRGPYQVMEKVDSIYTIEDLVSGKRIVTHVHNLRPFIYDPDRTSPLSVAQQNEQEFVVEAILGHRGRRNRHSTLAFRVRWVVSETSMIAGNLTRDSCMSASSMITCERIT